VSNWPIMYVRW